MVDAIIRITVVLVMVVALVNLGHGVLLAGRLARRVSQRQPNGWLGLLLPTWRSPREAVAWLATWRALFTSADPIIAAVRRDGRTVMMRHAQLFAWCETWAMLVLFVS
jgi:hypothetical protein